MSVSVTEGNANLDAIMAGGDEFLARLQTFREAKANHDRAFADLGLGRDAKAALDEAQRVL